MDVAVSVPDGVLIQELDGEAVLLNLDSGRYFGLDEVGTSMWNALARHGRVRFAYEALLAEYEVSEVQLQEELLDLIGKLAGFGLLQIDIIDHAQK